MLNFVNISYLLWMSRAISKDGVVESKCDMIHKWTLEIAIQIFLVTCIFFWKDKDKDYLSTAWSVIIQLIAILAIFISIFFEFVMVVVNTCRGKFIPFLPPLIWLIALANSWKNWKHAKDNLSRNLLELDAFDRPHGAPVWKINERGVERMRPGRR